MTCTKGKLTRAFYRQSKLSQDELNQLQKDTHFDKKELQQWYKGEWHLSSCKMGTNGDFVIRLP